MLDATNEDEEESEPMNMSNSGRPREVPMAIDDDSDISDMAWWKNKFLYGVKTLMEGWRTVFKWRPDNGRFCLIMLIIAFVMEMFTMYLWSPYFFYMPSLMY